MWKGRGGGGLGGGGGGGLTLSGRTRRCASLWHAGLHSVRCVLGKRRFDMRGLAQFSTRGSKPMVRWLSWNRTYPSKDASPLPLMRGSACQPYARKKAMPAAQSSTVGSSCSSSNSRIK